MSWGSRGSQVHRLTRQQWFYVLCRVLVSPQSCSRPQIDELSFFFSHFVLQQNNIDSYSSDNYVLCESHVCPFSMHGNSIQSHLFISSSNIIRNGLPPYYCPIDVNNFMCSGFFFFSLLLLVSERKKISKVYDDVYCHSLSNTTFIVRWWGWGGLREWSGGGGGGCCAWSICLVKQLCIRWMSKNKGGRRGFTVWKINPGFCCVLLFGFSHELIW